MTTSTSEPIVFTGDPYSEEHLLNPYPFLASLQEAGSVSWLESEQTYAITGYDEVYEVLTDFETFVSSGGLGPRDIRKDDGWRPPSILESDPPIHTLMRRALTGVINPGTVRALRKDFTAPAVSLVEALVQRNTFDAITDLAEKYPIEVFPDAVGIPQEGREHLLPYGNMVFNAFGPENYIYHQAFAEGDEHARVVMNACKRESLTDSGFGAGIWAKVGEGLITEEQATLLVRALLSAGVDTTIFGIGNTLSVLARHPEAWERLRKEPSLAKFAIDEALRLESPFQKFHRTTTVDTELGGVGIPAGSKVQVFIGAANRDPKKWGADANEFSLERTSSGHVAFGMGLHQCVGQPIARMEMEIVLQQLLEKVVSIELVGEPKPILHNVLRGFESMPVRITTQR
ncbi:MULTISPECIES: cytochrome P450 [Micrococcaceae]|uniref:cytochrome P450 n=1 Tax=Micrococcaceae TaxID=1268 RepID=UPI0008DD60EF|nr:MULTISPECIES: cytochrome P450 [Micrococcaceae]MDQ0092920.1 cytochrome P450 [Paeniglutamicibacter psychrophenolicus]OIH85684.1 cytochrome [Arthrobacter sp. UCD-GKA]